jgi:hypothetical protein
MLAFFKFKEPDSEILALNAAAMAARRREESRPHVKQLPAAKQFSDSILT